MIIHKDVEQNSEEWYKMRLGIPTSSMFSKLVTTKGEPSKSMKDYAMTLAGEAYANAPMEGWAGNQWSDRGHALEDEAREFYEMLYDCSVEQVSFVTDDKKTWGSSPDGLIDDGKGMLEIKCLKGETVIKKTDMYYRSFTDKKPLGQFPTDYYAQVQGQMFITEREYCDLLIYHPDLPPLVVRALPDKVFLKGLIEQKTAVLAERDRLVKLLREKA